MIGNYRSGFLWNLMRQCSYVIDDLRRAEIQGRLAQIGSSYGNSTRDARRCILILQLID